MKNKKVLVLPGDGIGKEVCDAALPVLDALQLPIELEFGEIGWECWRREGNAVPEKTWEQINQVDAVLLGAITSKDKMQAELELPEQLQGKNHKYISPVIQLRQRLELYANVRPSYYVSGNGKQYNLSVIRENTEGLYAGFDYKSVPESFRELIQHPNIDACGYDESAVSVRLQTKFGLKRLFEFAFEHAVQKGFKKVTFADKPNVMRESGDFAKAILTEVASKYPNIEFDIQNVDAVALWLATKPEKFGVIVAENMFGDILSDLAGGIMGGLGLAPSGNYGNRFAYFEPVHGSAPGMYGQNKANPSAMFLSIALMLEYLGFEDSAKQLQDAVKLVISKGDNLTYDFGGNASTQQLANEIINAVKGKTYKKSAAVITIGDELLSGEFHNTNLTDISKQLIRVGYDVSEHAVCSDSKSSISKAINRYLNDHELLVVCGGLGPTTDDVTRFAVADAMNIPLEFHEGSWQHIVTRMTSFNLPVNEEDKVQAFLPKDCEVLQNNFGLASGFKVNKGDHSVVVLPGPPSEMNPMLQNLFSAHDQIDENQNKQIWKLLGITETQAKILIDETCPSLADSAKYLFRYPYMNISLDVGENDVAAQQQANELNSKLEKFTVSRNGKSASELATKSAPAFWYSDDKELETHLKNLPCDTQGSGYLVNTSPSLRNILKEQNFTGSLQISCISPEGNEFQIATALRGDEVIEYIKEFACWCHLKNIKNNYSI